MHQPHPRRWRGPLPAAAVALLATGALALAGCGSTSSSDPAAPGAAAAGGSTTSGGRGELKVGVLQIAQAQVLDQTVKAFEQQLTRDLAPRAVSFDVKNAQGDDSLIQSIGRNFTSSGDGMIAVIGTPAVIAVAKLERQRPVIALAMGDPVGSKVSDSLTRSGTNVTGSIDFVDPRLILAQILRVSPRPATIGTVYDPGNENSAVWVKALKAATAADGLKLKEATIGGSGDLPAASREVAEGSDAVVIGPDSTVVAGIPAVASATTAHKLPLYVVAGDPTIPGVFATLGPSYPTLGAKTGALAATIAKGTRPQDTAWVQPGSVEWGINPRTLATLHVTVPAAVLKEAGVR